MKIKTMRFAYLEDVKRIEIGKRPLPKMNDDEVLIRQLGCNICTADYGQWIGRRSHQGFPMAGGHEGSGVVIAMGKDVKGFEEGDMVSPCLYGCGKCEFCQQGMQSSCVSTDTYDHITEDGYHLGIFGFADYFVRKADTLIKMSPLLDAAEANFLEPLATVVMGLKKLRVKPLENVVVIGAGTMGLVNALTLRAYGCHVIVTEIMENKIIKSRQLGFETVDGRTEDSVEAVRRLTSNNGADAVVLAVGNAVVNDQAIKMLKHMDGRILFFAANYPAPKLNVDSNIVHYRRMELIGTIGADKIDFFKAAYLLNNSVVDVSNLVEERWYKLDEAQAAFEHAASPNSYRVCIRTSE